MRQEDAGARTYLGVPLNRPAVGILRLLVLRGVPAPDS